MSVYSGEWNQDGVETFLADHTIPARLSFNTEGGDPWILSLWYLFENGALYCATTEGANVLKHLRSNPRCAFEISTNDVPYKGVRGKGNVTISQDDDFTMLKRLVDRYLGDRYESFREWLVGRDVQEYKIEIDPEKIYSWDYTDRMKESSE